MYYSVCEERGQGAQIHVVDMKKLYDDEQKSGSL